MRFFGILLFLPGYFQVLGQHTLSGSVSDFQSGRAIADVSVFFPELFKGTTTAEDGIFHISGISHGPVLIQVSHVGYETYFSRVLVNGDSSLNIVLTPSRTQMREVVITGTQIQSPDETSFNVVQMNHQQMIARGALSITDAIAQLPGVSQLTTGTGISKPVIRGLYGNRIQVNVNGIRFDNQQWQDEHGLGLSDMGVDRVEVIRGPASVLNGSDAMGGVVNIIEEKPAPIDTKERDANVRLYSNTYGLSLNAGARKSGKNRWRKLRVGMDNHADYSDGNNDRVLNSRFASYNLKAGWGIDKRNSVHVFNIMASHSLFGFVFDSLSRKAEDGRLSRKFDGPHHIASFVQASSENTYYKARRKIKFNAGLISNLRLEDEGGGGISLAMLLNSLNALVQCTGQVGTAGEWTYGSSAFLQSNTNFGGRIIIPDAINVEGSLFSLYKHHGARWLWEAGLRYDAKFIETFATETLNVPGNDSPGEEILPFSQFYNAANLMLGATYHFTPALSTRFNASTGYRPGNLAELSSNGLHEGTLRWEIGLPSAVLEQNLNVEGALTYASKIVRASISYYRNRFWNFFYLAPTGEEFYGFQVYRYQQSDATLQGGEVSLDWQPGGGLFALNTAYSLIAAKKDNGDYLPFIPANKLMTELRFYLKSHGNLANPMFKAGADYVFDQHRPSEFETPTDGYLLINAGFSGGWKKTGFSLICTNLLNNNYYDHLSRFKYYGIANMGRNIVFSVNFNI